MPTFNFSLPKKKDKERKASNNSIKHEVIERDIIGVIWIDCNANYFVHINGNKYTIKRECYSCKGKRAVYRQGQYDRNRVCYIRHSDNYAECNPLHWLPFAPGCMVKGNIIRHSLTKAKLFVIKNCYVDYDNNDAHAAIEYYREHYAEIIEKHKIKYG